MGFRNIFGWLKILVMFDKTAKAGSESSGILQSDIDLEDIKNDALDFNGSPV